MRAFDESLPLAPPIAITGELAPPTVEQPAPVHQQDSPPELGGSLDDLSTCRYCWGRHPGACPFIKVIEWHPSGQIARVVLKERPDHEDKIIYPGDEDEK